MRNAYFRVNDERQGEGVGMKLEMLKGLPASGKTTLARRKVREDGNSGRINRDDLRAMLFDSAWTGKREKVVVACEKAIAAALFQHGMNAVVDDTNLGQSHRDMWSNFTKEQGQRFEVADLGVSVEECRDRDWRRDRQVGRAVIDRMALSNGLIDWADKPIVLCDIDGTIADGRHREHFVTGGAKDWKSYYVLLMDDAPIDFVIRWVRELFSTHTVCLVSGRPDTYQHETMIWLAMNQVPYHWLFKRRGSDSRPDVMVKNEILERLPKDKIASAIDDRPVVIREVLRANNVRVFPVRVAYEEF